MGRKTGRKMDQAALSADKGKKGAFSLLLSRERKQDLESIRTAAKKNEVGNV